MIFRANSLLTPAADCKKSSSINFSSEFQHNRKSLLCKDALLTEIAISFPARSKFQILLMCFCCHGPVDT